MRLLLFLAGCLATQVLFPSRTAWPGFSLHFDFFNSAAEAQQLLDTAEACGARVLNVTPPPHIWQEPQALEILRHIFAFAESHAIRIILTRIDASTPDPHPELRHNYLYSHVLNHPGRLPGGQATPDFFCATVGNTVFEDWMKEETAFYARNFSQRPALAGFSIGLFNEPFVSQRGSLICYDFTSNSYELAQYTPGGRTCWREWLETHLVTTAAVMERYGISCRTMADVPMPLNDRDDRFGRPERAYWDLVSAVNDWVIGQYEINRAIWHREAKRQVPFILQFSGFLPEKLVLGRPAFAALDICDWMARADALGLSLYTNADYPDRGHASVRTMCHLLLLGRLLGKELFVLESGFEDDGAALDSRELAFFSRQAGLLRPRSAIYEFFKMTYDETFARHDGKIVDSAGAVNRSALEQVRRALDLPDLAAPRVTVVLDDPALLRDDPEEMACRRDLLRRAADRPLVFVPRRALRFLPAGSILAVPSRLARPDGKSAPPDLRRLRLVDWHTLLQIGTDEKGSG